MQKQQIIVISGILLGVIAIFMVKVYLDQQRQIIKEEEKKKLESIQTGEIQVLVAKTDIPQGAIIELNSLEVNIIPKQFVQPQAITSSYDRIAGMITIAPISKGEQITLTKLAYSKQKGSLAESTPVGKRAITISVDNIAALAGMIKAGDYVDVITTLPIPVQTVEGKQITQAAVLPLFQNILVLAVGQELDTATAQARGRYTKEEKKDISPLITLALTPQEANLIAFVQEQGRIRLVLRSPADSQIQPVQPPANWETLFQYIFPKETKPAVEEEYVDIYRGLSKERVPLHKK